jgi:hypothetical protein
MSASIMSDEISAKSMSVADAVVHPLASRPSSSSRRASRRQFASFAATTRSRCAAASGS